MSAIITTLQDVALAIYIGKNGEIVGSESIDGSKDVANNTLQDPPRSGEETEILYVEVRVETRAPSRDGCCGTARKLRILGTCYDRFGKPYKC